MTMLPQNRQPAIQYLLLLKYPFLGERDLGDTKDICVLPASSLISWPGQMRGSTEFLTSLVLPESIAQPHSKYIMNHSSLIDYVN